MTFAVQASSTSSDVAFAVAMFSFFRAFGQTVGVAIGGTIFQNQMKLKLLTYPALAPMAAQYSRDAASLVAIIKDYPPGLDKNNLIQSYADALKIVWVTLCGLSALALITSFWIKGLDINRALETDQAFQQETRVPDIEKTPQVESS